MHLHEMRDSDNHFVIDPVTMAITNSSDKHTLQQGDHNSEIYSFEIPRHIEGHDMTLCNLVEIHYINIKRDKTERSEDVHSVVDMAASEDDPDTLVFTWTIHGNATKYAGSLNFRIRFACTDANGAFTYKKHTEIFKGITISDGFDNAASIEEEYSDILSQWNARVYALEEYMAKNSASVVSIATISLAADAWVGSGNLYSQVVDVPGVTEKSQVDLTPGVEQLAVFYDKSLALVAENEDGVVTVYAIGQKPENDYTIQVTITEVIV